MGKDISWNVLFENNERFADLINGCACNGNQMVQSEDLYPIDSKNIQKGRKKSSTRYRDMVRRAVFGVNFAVIGIEHQETVNYAMPLSLMHYDLGEYNRQKRSIMEAVRKQKAKVSNGEYLYGFQKDSRIQPVVTFVLYSGEDWDGPTELYDILNFSDIPDFFRGLVQNYKVNLINIRQLKDTSIFKTDLRLVFDFIRYSKDKCKRQELIRDNPDYMEVSEDAYDVMVKYAHVTDLRKEKVMEGDKVNMCQAMKEWAEEERAEGRLEGSRIGADEKTRTVVRNMLKRGMADEDVMALAECSMEMLEEERAKL